MHIHTAHLLLSLLMAQAGSSSRAISPSEQETDPGERPNGISQLPAAVPEQPDSTESRLDALVPPEPAPPQDAVAVEPTTTGAAPRGDAPAGSTESVARVDRHESVRRARWQLTVSLGTEQPWAASAQWFAHLGEPAVQFRGSRTLDRLLPGLSVELGTNLWRGDRVSSQTESLVLSVVELESGVLWQWPADGIGAFVFPYGRLALLAGYWRLRLGDELGDDLFVPGLRAGLGVRIHFGRLVVDPTGRVRGGRVFSFAEMQVAGRWPQRPTLETRGVDNPLPGPPTRLGALNLSSWSLALGMGWTF